MRLDTNSNEDFKALGTAFCKIKPENLSTWGGSAKQDTRLPITDYSTLGGPVTIAVPFPYPVCQ
ncbi:hypothetical protein DOY81_012565 [Sarcophaga bullata]|nr:hypothetical protein DOY81_012565 [Sarcophaga bullata]